jgi:putative oxidoreductase
MACCRQSDLGGCAVTAVRRHLVIVLRIALGGVFLYAGAVKTGNLNAFAGDIAAYRLLPHFANYLAAAILPWLEAICGLLLITGWRVRAALTTIMLLTVLFMAVLSSTLFRGLDIDCGCFRHGGTKTSAWVAMGRDSLLLVAAVLLLRKTGGKRS